jgi:hypothetical protein
MLASKLYTRQYIAPELLWSPRAGPGELTSRLRIAAVTTAGAISLVALSGSGIARADNDHEREACALMDDKASAIHFGYSSVPVQYAFTVLSREMPAEEAAHTLLAATRDDCPNHAADLPPGWQ